MRAVAEAEHHLDEADPENRIAHRRPELGPIEGLRYQGGRLIRVIAAIVLGIIGVVAEGLLYLLVIGIVVFVAALVYLGMYVRRSGRHSRTLR
ncbi:hypothetical protein ABZY68_34820 [Streptomyces sp. NPDC006482]|uniref:hypothetical protein n=1 Tax=Streptomyces sp. NPDC006482 TaxID=3154306 RepID=UPI0033B46655